MFNLKPNKMKTEQFASHLVATRCLSLLFYNFTTEDIDHLKKVREFEYRWTPLVNRAEREQWSHISDKEFYNLFVNVSYETQAHIIERALERYQEEAERAIGFSMQIKKIQKALIKKAKENEKGVKG
jgi:CRISPR/Cas system CMR-associated protein Cmr5 small subunit